jgi:ribonuclease Z
MGETRRGCHVAYVTDTAPTPSIAALVKDTDLALVEGMFLAEHESEARDKKHLTAQQTGQIARQAGARRLALIHLSPRYEDRDRPRFEEEVRLHHDHALIAQDGMQLEVSVCGDGEDNK